MNNRYHVEGHSGIIYFVSDDKTACVNYINTQCPNHPEYYTITDNMNRIEAIEQEQGLTLGRGMGKDAPMVTNEAGGKQSHVPYRMDLVPADALLDVAKVLSEGAVKYGENNWKLISINEHINHVLSHLYVYLADDTSDDHLSHAVCRAMFALQLYIEHTQNSK